MEEIERWEGEGGTCAEPPAIYPPSMSDAELKKFVMGWCDGHIFSSYHMEQRGEVHNLPIVFMVIALGALADVDDTSEIALVYEWLDKAGKTGINGMPIFFSARIMNRRDWARARSAINREHKRREAVTL